MVLVHGFSRHLKSTHVKLARPSIQILVICLRLTCLWSTGITGVSGDLPPSTVLRGRTPPPSRRLKGFLDEPIYVWVPPEPTKEPPPACSVLSPKESSGLPGSPRVRTKVGPGLIIRIWSQDNHEREKGSVRRRTTRGPPSGSLRSLKDGVFHGLSGLIDPPFSS